MKTRLYNISESYRKKIYLFKKLILILILTGMQVSIVAQNTYEINLEWRFFQTNCFDHLDFGLFLSSSSGNIELNNIDIRLIYDADKFNNASVIAQPGYSALEIAELQGSVASGQQFFDFVGAPVFFEGQLTYTDLNFDKIILTSTPKFVLKIELDLKDPISLFETICVPILFDQIDNSLGAISFDGTHAGIEVSIGGPADEAHEIVDHYGWDYGIGNGVFGGIDSIEACKPYCSFFLPIEWYSFDVLKKKNNALLQWTTASEDNNSHFEIQRSLDGLNFNSLDVLEAIGNSTVLRHYHYTDRSPKKGVNYYRIKQVDIDGTSTYSEIKALRIDNGNTDKIQISPNPVKDKMILDYAGSEWSGPTSIEIYSPEGQLLQVIQHHLSDNSQRLEIDLAGLKSGMYILKTTSALFSKTISFVYIRD